MITDKDMDATNKYVDEIGAMFNDDMHGFRSEVYILVSRIRAESAEQALSDLPDDRLVGEITKRCRNGKKKFYSCMLSPLQSFNNPSADHSTDTEKLTIAVAALEVIRDNALNPAHTMTKLGLEQVTDANRAISDRALKEIQG